MRRSMERQNHILRTELLRELLSVEGRRLQFLVSAEREVHGIALAEAFNAFWGKYGECGTVQWLFAADRQI